MDERRDSYNAAMDERLLPCPFCGSTPETRHLQYLGGHVVRCFGCGTQTMAHYRPVEAVEAWNRRPVGAKAGGQLAEARKAVCDHLQMYADYFNQRAADTQFEEKYRYNTVAQVLAERKAEIASMTVFDSPDALEALVDDPAEHEALAAWCESKLPYDHSSDEAVKLRRVIEILRGSSIAFESQAEPCAHTYPSGGLCGHPESHGVHTDRGQLTHHKFKTQNTLPHVARWFDEIRQIAKEGVGTRALNKIALRLEQLEVEGHMDYLRALSRRSSDNRSGQQ